MSDVQERLSAALGGHYRIERELGAGGMATVYLAHDVRHGRKVALKVLLPDLAATIGADSFLREVRITAGLTHPHILPLLDSGEAAGLLYYVTPYADGGTLRDRLKNEPQLPIETALAVARQVADALAHAHSRGGRRRPQLRDLQCVSFFGTDARRRSALAAAPSKQWASAVALLIEMPWCG